MTGRFIPDSRSVVRASRAMTWIRNELEPSPVAANSSVGWRTCERANLKPWEPSMRPRVRSSALACLVVLSWRGVDGQQADLVVIDRIKREAFERSQVMEHLRYLTRRARSTSDRVAAVRRSRCFGRSVD